MNFDSRILILIGCLLVSGTANSSASDTFDTAAGPLEVTPITHGSLQLAFGGLVIQVDPWSRGDYSTAPTADLILVTDIHGDHLDAAMIEQLSDAETQLVVPAAVAEELGRGTVLANGESMEIDGITIEAVPMYNLVRGPEEGQLFHNKGRGNGYLLTLGGKRVYIAGDTECTAEMKALEDIDIAFVPMNLPYTMPPDEAAACVAIFKPAVVYPYHYRGSDLEVFETGLADVPEVEVRLRDWYPGD